MSQRWLTCDPPGWALLLSYLDVILETDFVCHHRRPIVAITFILAHRQAVVKHHILPSRHYRRDTAIARPVSIAAIIIVSFISMLKQIFKKKLWENPVNGTWQAPNQYQDRIC